MTQIYREWAGSLVRFLPIFLGSMAIFFLFAIPYDAVTGGFSLAEHAEGALALALFGLPVCAALVGLIHLNAEIRG